MTRLANLPKGLASEALQALQASELPQPFIEAAMHVRGDENPPRTLQDVTERLDRAQSIRDRCFAGRVGEERALAAVRAGFSPAQMSTWLVNERAAASDEEIVTALGSDLGIVTASPATEIYARRRNTK
jgi:hypothetical protein